MRFTTPLILLVTTVAGAMIGLKPANYATTDGTTFHPAAEEQNTCSMPAAYRSYWRVPSSDWRDCAALYSDWAAEHHPHGKFEVYALSDSSVATRDSSNFVTLVQYRSCSLEIQAAQGTMIKAKNQHISGGTVTTAMTTGGNVKTIKIGNEDIKDMLYNALIYYGTGSLLNVEGRIPCDSFVGNSANSTGRALMNFRIYNGAI